MFSKNLKVFSINFGMGTLILSTFLGSIQWKIVRQYKNSDFYSIYYTATANLFEISEMLPGILWNQL